MSKYEEFLREDFVFWNKDNLYNIDLCYDNNKYKPGLRECPKKGEDESSNYLIIV